MKGPLDFFVVRHAIAADQDPIRWPDDADRPLTMEGEAAFRKVAQRLAKLTSPVATVLSSPFVRARRTAEILHEEADWPPPEPFQALEADRDAQGVLDAL